MFVVTVNFSIHPDSLSQFMALIKENAKQSIQLEKGCHVFDVCTSDEQAEIVFLYEVYENKEAFQTHLKSDHFIAFDKLASNMVASKSVSTYKKSEL